MLIITVTPLCDGNKIKCVTINKVAANCLTHCIYPINSVTRYLFLSHGDKILTLETLVPLATWLWSHRAFYFPGGVHILSALVYNYPGELKRVRSHQWDKIDHVG